MGSEAALPGARRFACLDGLGGYGFRLCPAGPQRGHCRDHLVGELPLVSKQVLGELVPAGHNRMRLRQAVGQRHADDGIAGMTKMHGLDQGLERIERDSWPLPMVARNSSSGSCPMMAAMVLRPYQPHVC